jgi:hypothetical protein
MTSSQAVKSRLNNQGQSLSARATRAIFISGRIAGYYDTRHGDRVTAIASGRHSSLAAAFFALGVDPEARAHRWLGWRKAGAVAGGTGVFEWALELFTQLARQTSRQWRSRCPTRRHSSTGAAIKRPA